ncbi:MAG: hypothetical protein HY821_02420 [Acidobacteria bacterium]|nr:hypothetical protein [Acidobacteriota bacterium]
MRRIRTMGVMRLGLLIVAAAAMAAGRDLNALAAKLKSVHGAPKMSTEQFHELRGVYLEWIDAQVKAGHGVTEINRGLTAAHLIQHDPPEDLFASQAGFLEPVTEVRVRSTREVRVLALPIHVGGNCQLDVSAAVYERRGRRRIGVLRVEEELGYAAYLSTLDVGAADAKGARLAASGWVTANCTSSWNGKTLRIDRLSAGTVKPLMEREVSAQDWQPVSVAAGVRGSQATFAYRGGIRNGAVLSLDAATRYRVKGDTVLRESPLALSRVGFIQEWLELPEVEAQRWSDAQPLLMRPQVAAALKDQYFEFGRVERQPGPAEVWDVTLIQSESRIRYQFRMGGSRASRLRLLALTVLAPAKDKEEESAADPQAAIAILAR